MEFSNNAFGQTSDMAFAIPTRPLCSNCKSMFAPESFELWRSWYEQHPGEIDGFPKKFHSTIQDRLDAMAADCWICTRFQDCCNPPNASIDYAFLRYDDSPQHVVQFYSTDGENEYNFNFRKLNIWRQNMPDDLFDSAAKSRAGSYMGQADTLDLASKWLKVCQDSHQCLGEGNSDLYPSRLLDVSVNGTIRLVLTAEEHVSGQYATLSHCWGQDKFLVLEPDTITKFTDGCPLEEIPRTFQEVIQVIKHLKIRYLWIDSYCIIQGDSEDAREDWNREAQKMCSVYTNSYLNIGSAYSKNPHGGLFRQRDVDKLSCDLILKWRPTTVEEESFYSICVDFESTSSRRFEPLFRAFYDLDQGAMSKRAWVVQETVLSPRMLTFTKNQLIWQCSEGAACETAPAQSRESILEVEKRSPFWATENGLAPPSSLGKCPDDMPKLLRRWFNTLNKYLEAELSYPGKDRLKALDGIAEHFSRLTNRAYRYGMLDGTMPQALLWASPDNRPTGIGPSWHWASLSNAMYTTLGYGDLEALSNPRSVETLAHTFLQEHDMASESKASTNSALDINWPTLICVGRLLEPMADPWLEVSWLSCRLRLPMSIRLLDPSVDTDGMIDEGNWTSLRDRYQRDIRILPLIYKDPVIWTLVLRIEESGFYKRIGILQIASPGGKIRAIQQQLAKRKPSLIIIK